MATLRSANRPMNATQRFPLCRSLESEPFDWSVWEPRQDPSSPLSRPRPMTARAVRTNSRNWQAFACTVLCGSASFISVCGARRTRHASFDDRQNSMPEETLRRLSSVPLGGGPGFIDVSYKGESMMFSCGNLES